MKFEEKLKYFLGKPCSVLLIATNWRLDIQQTVDYCTGIIESIDYDHLWMKHSQTGCRNCFALEHLVGIAEEQVLYPEIPEHKKLMDEYKKPQFLDIKKLEELKKKSGV